MKTNVEVSLMLFGPESLLYGLAMMPSKLWRGSGAVYRLLGELLTRWALLI